MLKRIFCGHLTMVIANFILLSNHSDIQNLQLVDMNRYKPMLEKYIPMEKKYNILTTQQPIEVDTIFEKKWMACLWCYYCDFDQHSAPTLPSELYDARVKYLRKNGVLTSDAFVAQTVTLRKHQSLYAIKPRPRVGAKYSIPFLYMISRRGILKLEYLGMVSPEKRKKVERIISSVAREYGVPIRS